ncbi:MAG: hypothetical protein RLN75_06180 [Longimicrobiales bacterium]
MDEFASSREPAFAVVDDGVGIRIMYLLAYHYDSGWDHLPWPWSAGHAGDSEFVVITLDPNGSNWEITSMITSAHWDTIGDWSWVAQGDEIGAFGTNPLVFVSKGKHGNYHTLNRCQDHYYDDCLPSAAPVESLSSVDASTRNVGSSGYPMMDCVASHSGKPGVECFWNPIVFGGWLDDDWVTGYGTILLAFGMD